MSKTCFKKHSAWSSVIFSTVYSLHYNRALINLSTNENVVFISVFRVLARWRWSSGILGSFLPRRLGSHLTTKETTLTFSLLIVWNLTWHFVLSGDAENELFHCHHSDPAALLTSIRWITFERIRTSSLSVKLKSELDKNFIRAPVRFYLLLFSLWIFYDFLNTILQLFSQQKKLCELCFLQNQTLAVSS